MIEIGIPVYKARATLRKLLDSLMAQTCEDPPTRTFWTRGATPRRIHHLNAIP